MDNEQGKGLTAMGREEVISSKDSENERSMPSSGERFKASADQRPEINSSDEDSVGKKHDHDDEEHRLRAEEAISYRSEDYTKAMGSFAVSGRGSMSFVRLDFESDRDCQASYKIRLDSAVRSWCKNQCRRDAVTNSKNKPLIFDKVKQYLVQETAIMHAVVLAEYKNLIYPGAANPVVDFICNGKWKGVNGGEAHECTYRHLRVCKSSPTEALPVKSKVRRKGTQIEKLTLSLPGDSQRIFRAGKNILPISFGDVKFQLPEDYEAFQKTTLYEVLEYIGGFTFDSLDVVLFATTQAATCEIYNILKKERREDGGATPSADYYTDGLQEDADSTAIQEHLHQKAEAWIEAFTPYLKRTDKTPEGYIPLEERVKGTVNIFGVEQLTEGLDFYPELLSHYQRLAAESIGHDDLIVKVSGSHDGFMQKAIGREYAHMQAAQPKELRRDPDSPGRKAKDGELSNGQAAIQQMLYSSLSLFGENLSGLEGERGVSGEYSAMSVNFNCRQWANLLDDSGLKNPDNYQTIFRAYIDYMQSSHAPGSYKSLADCYEPVKTCGSVLVLLDLVVMNSQLSLRSSNDAWCTALRAVLLSHLLKVAETCKKLIKEDDVADCLFNGVGEALDACQAFKLGDIQKEAIAIPLDALPHLALLDFSKRHCLLTSPSEKGAISVEKRVERFRINCVLDQFMHNLKSSMRPPTSPRMPHK